MALEWIRERERESDDSILILFYSDDSDSILLLFSNIYFSWALVSLQSVHLAIYEYLEGARKTEFLFSKLNAWLNSFFFVLKLPKVYGFREKMNRIKEQRISISLETQIDRYEPERWPKTIGKTK